MKRSRASRSRLWQMIAYGCCAALFVVMLLGFRIGTLHTGYSGRELATLLASDQLSDVWDNPVNAPYKIATGLAFKIHHTLLTTRLVSALIGAAIIALMFFLLKKWHDTRTAVLGTVLFAASAWFLHIARLGTPDVLQMGVVLGVLGLGFWLRRYTQPNLQVIAATLFVMTALFAPGMVWLLGLAIGLGWRDIGRVVQKANRFVVTGSFFAIFTTIGLLTWRLWYAGLSTAVEWLGLPTQVPSIFDVLRNIIFLPLYLFARGPDNPEIWLGQLPLLSSVAIALFALGIAYYVRNPALERIKPFASIAMLGALLVIINGAAYVHLLLPIIFIIATSGLFYLLKEWFRVFPRNPLARGFGVGLVTAMLAVNVLHCTRHYFVAWPQAPETRQTFNR